MRKLLLCLAAFIAVSTTTCLTASAQGKIGQRVAQLQQQNVFTRQISPLKLSSTQFDEQSENTVRNYTLLDLSPDLNNIVNTQPDYLRMSIPVNQGHNTLTVLLFKENISPNGFKMEVSDGSIYNPEKKPVNYRGIVEGNPLSVSAFTFAEGEIMGLISNGGGNYVVGKLEGNTSAGHIIYNDADLIPAFNFDCAANTMSAPVLDPKDGNLPTTQSVNCVNWYWEIDYDVFVGKGSLANVNTYVNGIFNQVSTLYANDGMSITLKTVYVWTSTDPYTGPSTSDYLNQFGTNRTSFNGDLANLIGYAGGGGVAYVNGICASTQYRIGYCGISSSYQTVPTYSWTVEVVAHEEGHLFGSSHTHDCKWNGNNTRIDNCGPAAGYSSGTCAAGPIPTKGTIMSYCHLSPNPGIDLSLGFGSQPTALMLSKVNNASCLTACSGCATPAQPGTVTGSTAVCPSTSQTYSITAISGATSYTWVLPSGWSGSSTTNSITVTAGTAGGTLSVTANNTCGSSAARTLTVTVSASTPAQPGTISGSATVCPSTSQTYSVAAVSGATSYTWTLPSGWSGSSTTTSITATSGSAGGSITVKANNGCGSSAVRSLTVSISGAAPAQPGTISGNVAVCPSTSQTYSVAAVSGATSYTWTLPSGWSGSSTTTSITTTAGSAGGSLTVKAHNSCGSSVVRSLTVSISAVPAQPGTISGNSSVCVSTSQTYTIAAVAGATSYSWTLPSGWSGSSTTNSITASAGTAGGSITVKANNGCGSSTVRSLTVSVSAGTPTKPGTITGSATACAGQLGVPYSITPVAGATSYKWIVPAGAKVSDGTTTSTGNNLITTATSVTVNFGTTSGNVRVRAINNCGMGQVRTKSVTFNCREAGTMVEQEDVLDVKVYPNPSATNFTIAIENAEDNDIYIYVYDATGRLAKPVIEKAASVATISGLPAGVYSAVIKTKNYNKVFRLIKTE